MKRFVWLSKKEFAILMNLLKKRPELKDKKFWVSEIRTAGPFYLVEVLMDTGQLFFERGVYWYNPFKKTLSPVKSKK